MRPRPQSLPNQVFLYPVTMLVGMIVLLCLGNVNLSRVSIYFLGLGVP